MPKIIISNYDDRKNPYYGGGGAVAIHEVAARLAQSFSVTVFTSKYPGSADQVIDGVLYRRLGLPFLGPRLGQMVFQLLLPFFALQETYDIWLESFAPPFTCSFLPLVTPKPVIGLVHMLPALDMQRKYGFPLLPRLVEILALKLYSRFIVLSDVARKDVSRYHPQAAIHVIPNGVHLPPHLPVLSPQHILFIGRLEVNQKGLDLLLFAYKLLESSSLLPLVIAGSGSPADESRLRRLISQLDLTDKVVLTGRVAGSVRDRLFRQAIFVVIPSRFETFPLVALETLSYSKPLICFDIPGLKWIPTFCSQKAVELTPASLSKVMTECLNSFDLRRRLSCHSRRFAHSFSWDTVAARYSAILSDLVSQKVISWSTSSLPRL